MRICPQCKRSFGEEDFRACPFDGASLAEETALPVDPMLGRVLDGRFRIVETIGQGGMGAVYKAVHTQMDRICAIKLLAPATTDREAAIARFRREAKMTSRIDSPNAITIYDFGEAEPGLLYLAMEYIEGESLAEVLAREGRLTIKRVVNITNQIARGLAAAHSLGIVHRDLKPANIMLTHKKGDRDIVKVLDFGIAKTMTDSKDDNLTQTGFLVGTPTYMSPEQVLGEGLDSRSDVYSLSIIVYQMLSGLLPFEGDNLQTVMMKRVNSEPKPLRATAPLVNEAIERVVMSGLARDPGLRISDVETFAAALNAASVSSVPSHDDVTVIADGRNTQIGSSARLEETHLTAPSPAANRNPVTSSSATVLSPAGTPPNLTAPPPVSPPQPAYSHDTIGVAPWQLPISSAASPASGTSGSKLAVILIVAFLAVLLLALSGGGYYLYQRSKQEKSPIASNQPASHISQPLTDPKTGSAIPGGGGDRLADPHYQAGKAHQVQASVLADAGSTTAAAAQNEQAIAEYRKAIESRPNFPEAHENIGVALYDLGKPYPAVAEYEVAIKQYEQPSAQVLSNYGMALLATKRFHEAAEAFSQALALKPTDVDLYYYRGFALHYAGDAAGSKAAFGRYLEVAPQGEHAKDVKQLLEGQAAPSLREKH